MEGIIARAIHDDVVSLLNGPDIGYDRPDAKDNIDKNYHYHLRTAIHLKKMQLERDGGPSHNGATCVI